MFDPDMPLSGVRNAGLVNGRSHGAWSALRVVAVPGSFRFASSLSVPTPRRATAGVAAPLCIETTPQKTISWGDIQ